MTDFDLSPAASQVLLIDMQERFVGAIPSVGAEGSVGKVAATLLAGATLLAVPVTISEQVPDKLGATLGYLRDAAPQATLLSKTHFSCMDDVAMRDHLAQLDRPQLIICGIEAHVCVMATVDDAIRRGYQVVMSAMVLIRGKPVTQKQPLTMRQLGAVVVPTRVSCCVGNAWPRATISAPSAN